MPPAQKQVLKKCALVSVAAGGGFLVWYALRAWLPPWLYWGIWVFYVAAAIAWTCYMAWNTYRIERTAAREGAELRAQVVREMERVLPIVLSTFKSMQNVEASRAELWRKVMGEDWPPRQTGETIQ